VPTSTPLPTITDAPLTATPRPTRTPLPVVQDGAQRYAVQSGDTCLDIANRFGVSLARLVAYNNFDARTCFLNVGQIVLIPPAANAVTQPAAATKPPIATALPTEAPTAAPTKIPTQSPTASAVPIEEPTTTPASLQTYYTVRPGDTCGGIAKRFGIRVADLAAANGLNANVCFLRAGQQLVIISSTSPTIVPRLAEPNAEASPSPTPTASQTIYVVKAGDTCLEIATRFKVTVNRLAAANNLNPRTCFLSIGRKLVIP
jgi:LysM repeat protein